MQSDGVLDAHGAGAMRGQVVAVTGAARGIGREVARELAHAGAHVRLLDVVDCSAAVADICSAGGSAQSVTVDVSDRAALVEAVRTIAGTGPLAAFVGCAAIYGEHVMLEEVSEDEVDQLLAVNVKGVLWSLDAVLPLMREAGGGRIVCIGSVAGKVGGVLSGPHYVASKGAVHALVKWAAKIGAEHGILVNGIAPGVVETPMIAGRGYTPDYCPLGRFARPEEIARVAVFLASPAASYMTGTIVDANGGYAMA